jgi:hypothetical protein
MKQLFLALSLIGLSLLRSYGQVMVPSPYSINLDSMYATPDAGRYWLQIMDAERAKLDSTNAGESARSIERSLGFWEHRVPTGMDSPFHRYLSAVQNAPYLSPCNASLNGQFNGNWKNTGPILSSQNQGVVWDVWVDPTNWNRIFICVENSGLWKTENANAPSPHWECISDGWSSLPTAGGKSLTVSPFNQNIMYFATQMPGDDHRNYVNGWAYGAGIWKSINGGQTWLLETNGFGTTPNTMSFEIIEYAPFRVNNNTDPVLFACEHNNLWQKIGENGTWINISNGLTGWDPDIFFLNDIVFDEDVPGKLYIPTSNGWGVPGAILGKVYEISYDPNTGLTNALTSCATLIDGTTTTIDYGPYSGVRNPLRFGASFAKQGNSRWLYVMTYPYIANNAFPQAMALLKYDLNTNTHQTILNDIQNNNWPTGSMLKIRTSPTNPEVIYFASTEANKIFKNGTGNWQYTVYPGMPNHHFDNRDVLIYQDGSGNDVTWWGTDGGLTKIEGNVSSNLNGDIITSEVYDVDIPGDSKRRIMAAMHNYGFSTLDNTSWEVMPVAGDGYNAIYDKRSNADAKRVIYGNQGGLTDQLIHTNTGITSGSFGFVQPLESPQSQSYPFPHDFKDDLFYVGKRAIFRSEPGGYGVNNSSYWNKATEFGDLGNGTNAYIINDARAFHISQRNNKRKYFAVKRYLGCEQSSANNQERRLFASYQPGLTQFWREITPSITLNPPPGGGDRFGISDVAIDSRNEDRYFVAFSQMSWPNNSGTILNKVWSQYYDPNLNTILANSEREMSEGLTQLPITSLVYQTGSNSILYAGTDNGVYRWDNTILPGNYNPATMEPGCWVKFCDMATANQMMPNVIVNDLEIDYCNGKLVAGTYGRGIWESDIYMPNGVMDVDIEINQNETWGSATASVQTSRNLEGSIRIKQGNTLTILGSGAAFGPGNTCTSNTVINMPYNGVIIIEKGAKLIVNGAKITNLCRNWYGIIAESDGTMPQNINVGTGLDINHGIAQLNKACIENADEGFSAFGGASSNNYGGIIQAEESIFLNCRRAAAFMSYHNTSGGNPSPELSYFNACHFEVNSQTKLPYNSAISMWDVEGLSITNCIFLNKQDLSQNHQWGITSIDASYVIDNCLFEGFFKGVESYFFGWGNSNWIFPTGIIRTHFNENQFGVKFNAMQFFLIKENQFNIGKFQEVPLSGNFWYNSYGCHLSGSHTFLYCNNLHFGIANPSGPGYTATPYRRGTFAENTGDFNEHIEWNHYINLEEGNHARGLCGTNPSGTNGLNYRHNRNEANLIWDFNIRGIINKKQSGYDAPNSLPPTRNIFTDNQQLAEWRHWPGSGNEPVIYHYWDQNGAPPPNLEMPDAFTGVYSIQNPPPNHQSWIVNLQASEYIDPSECGNTSLKLAMTGELTNTQLETLKSTFEADEITLHNLEQTLSLLIDDGNTPLTLQMIEAATSSEVMQIRTEMLNRSPYVSEEALRGLALEGILPHSILMEIIVANPDASRSERFINFLENEIPNPVSPALTQVIRGSWSGVTPRSILESSISRIQNDLGQRRKEIIMIMCTDPQFYNENQVLYWLNKLPTQYSKYQLAEYYLSIGNYLSAELELNSIPTAYRLTDTYLDDHNLFVQLYQFKKALKLDNKGINQLNATEIEQLQSIAEHQTSNLARSMARGPLCFFYNICYQDELDFEEPQSKIIGQFKTEKVHSEAISVYPNPGSEFVVFSTIGNQNILLDEVLITDLSGKQIHHFTLDNSAKQYIWDTRNVENGIYVYTAKDKFGIKYSGKVNIKH